MSKIRLNVNSKFQFKSKFGIKINQYSNYVDTLEVKFDYVFKTSYPAIYLYVERNDKSSNTLYSTQLILNQESNCYEYQFGSNDGDINGSWFTAIPGPLKVSFEIIDGDDKFTTDKYSIWINGSVTASNDKITLNANEFNNIINFIQEISDSKLSKSEYDINKNWYDVEEDFADNCITEVMHENGKRKIFFTSIGDEPTRYEAIGLVNQQNGTYYCVVYSPTGTSLYKRTSSDDYVTKINYKTSTTIFESEGAKPPIHLKSDMPYVVSDTPHKVGMRAYTEDGQMAGQFAISYDEEYSGHFASIQARCSEDEIHTFRVSHKGPTYHITKGETKEVHNIPFDENVVHNTGAETIGGNKTFERPISLKEVRNVNGKMQTQIDVKNSSYDKVGEIRFYKENSTQRNAVIIVQNDTDENITYKQLEIDDNGVVYSNDYTRRRLATQNDVAEAIINKADKSEVPTKTSDLNNDSGFIDRLVTNLANYYLKDETYSKEEITKLLGNISKIAFIPVDSLPEVGEEQVIYLVPKDEGVSPDIRDEYIYINGSWEIIGSTKVDLSNYLTIEQGDEKYALNTNTFSFAEVSVNTPKSLTIKDIYDSIQSQLPNQNSDVILLRITGYLTFTGFAEIRYVGAYLTSLYSFKDNKFVSNYYSADTYIDDILNSLSSNVDVSSDQEISGVKTFKTIKVKHPDKDNFFQITPDSNGYNVKFSFGNSVLMMLHNGGITNYRDILPDTNGTRNLGSPSALFKNIYLSGYLSDGTNNIALTDIALASDIPTDYVDLNNTQNIAGAKSFSRSITRGPKQEDQTGYVDIGAPGNSFDRGYITYLNAPISMVTFKPQYDNSLDLGGSNGRWRDLYLSGTISDGTYSIAVADIANKSDIPTKVSQLSNDSNYVDASVATLTNFYNKEEVTKLLNTLSGLKFEVVSELPTENISTTTIYLVPKNPGTTDNYFEEYIRLDSSNGGVWELIGNTSIDLSGYLPLTGGDISSESYNETLIIRPNQIGIHSPNEGNKVVNYLVDRIKYKFKSLYFPEKEGTFALLEDIPTFKTINGESIVGEGDIKIEGGSGGETRPLKVYVEAGVTEKQLEPNKYYIFDSQVANNITITLAEEDNTYLDEFMGEIKVDETAINITFPNIIRWNDNGSVTNTDGVLTLEAKNTYLFSVANSLGLITNIPNPSLAEAVYTISGSVVSWEEVANATSYDIYNDEILLIENTTSTSIDMSAYLTDVGEYTIKVISKSNYYVDSITTIPYYITAPLSTPTNLVLADTGTLSWDAVENAESYEVYNAFGTLLKTVTVNYVDLTTITTLTGTHTIKVKAINTTSPNVYTASELSEGVSYTWG